MSSKIDIQPLQFPKPDVLLLLSNATDFENSLWDAEDDNPLATLDRPCFGEIEDEPESDIDKRYNYDNDDFDYHPGSQDYGIFHHTITNNPTSLLASSTLSAPLSLPRNPPFAESTTSSPSATPLSGSPLSIPSTSRCSSPVSRLPVFQQPSQHPSPIPSRIPSPLIPLSSLQGLSPLASPSTTPLPSPLASLSTTPLPSPLASLSTSPLPSPLASPSSVVLPSAGPSTKKRLLPDNDGSDDSDISVQRVTKRQTHHSKSSRNNRNARRKAQRAAKDEPDERTKSFLKTASQPVQTTYSPSDQRVPKGGYSGMNHSKAELENYDKPYTLEQLTKEYGFQVIKWDGRTPCPLLDRDGTAFALLAGRPNDAGYDTSMAELFRDIQANAQSANLDQPSKRPQRRGRGNADDVGTSHGGGQKCPQKLAARSKTKARYVDEIVNHLATGRARRFAERAMSTYSNPLYNKYKKTMADLKKLCPELYAEDEEPSIFACTAINWPIRGRHGNTAWAYKHRDVRNLAYGWCAILALGNFDPTEGGHLILWDLEVVIEFPAYSTILIPSATLLHSNVPPKQGQSRCSLTFYTAGGLFRWVRNGGKTDKQLLIDDPAEYKTIQKERSEGWMAGYKLWWTQDQFMKS